VQLPGQSSFTSPPTAANGTVYVGGAGTGGTLYAVDEATGSLRWSAPVMNGDHSSPAVTATGVYVSYACGQAYDFDPGSGALIWHHSGPCEGGGGKTPAYANGSLYVRDPIAGNLVLDGSTGAVLGSFAAGPVPAFTGGAGFFLSGSGLSAENVATSAVLWSFTGDGALDSAPVVANGYVYEGSSSGNLYALNSQSGQQVWSANVGSAITAPDEQNADELTGMAVGGGVLVVSASNTVIAYTGPIPGSTSVQLVASANPAVVTTSITFTATVTGSANTARPTGSVTFSDGSKVLGTVALPASGQASLVVSTLAVGQHQVVASYGGDAGNAPSAASLPEGVVKAASATTVTTSATPVRRHTPVTFTAMVSVTPASVSLAGGDAVSFYDGPATGTLLCTATLTGGQASCKTSSLTVGSHMITAVFSGDANLAPSTGQTTETVKN
jgi:hypothetical protein